MMRVFTVTGARPQFVKAAPVQRALRAAGIEEFFVHTGQHYDFNMSGVFFEELGLRPPDVNLGIGSGSHGAQTGQMLIAVEKEMAARKPDIVLVYGDTNSTLAAALAAAKLNIPVAHVEAGLRSFNREMPEEHNRVLTDHCSDLLFCPTVTAVDLLKTEGVTRGVHLVGDTMLDATLQFGEIAQQQSRILQTLAVAGRAYILLTLHRPYNVDVPERLSAILTAVAATDETIIFPVHPRTRHQLTALGQSLPSSIRAIEPVGYLDMLVLEKNARLVVTDSGGVQKEAFFFGVPCVTARPETEWVETVGSGWNVLVGADPVRIADMVQRSDWPVGPPPALFGDGSASQKIAQILACR
jgi:UDP-N-acetylglucosamine 2-epimerase